MMFIRHTCRTTLSVSLTNTHTHTCSSSIKEPDRPFYSTFRNMFFFSRMKRVLSLSSKIREAWFLGGQVSSKDLINLTPAPHTQKSMSKTHLGQKKRSVGKGVWSEEEIYWLDRSAITIYENKDLLVLVNEPNSFCVSGQVFPLLPPTVIFMFVFFMLPFPSYFTHYLCVCELCSNK